MNNKNFIQALGFAPKENTSGIFHKSIMDTPLKLILKTQFSISEKK